MKISVIGLGYVGFPLACAIAKQKKYEVVGFDLNEKKINKIKNKTSPIEDKQAQKDIKKVFFEVSTDETILENSDFFLVCVPTPITNNYLPDLKFIKNATEICAKYLKDENIVVIESTVNPGICDDVVIPLLEKKSKLKISKNFDVAHCPERINPGDPKWNVYNIPRNIGASSPSACKKTANFYRSFLKAEINEMETLKEAEATKIIENTFRDINIAYVNELAKSFDVMGIDLKKVLDGASNKPFAFIPHFPSCGVGGHCIPVDPYYLIEKAKNVGFDHKFLRTARDINNSMPAYTVNILEKVLEAKKESIVHFKIGVLGISYKANIRDKRESPALEIISILQKKSQNIEIFDPYFLKESTVKNLLEFFEKVDAIILATNHQEFETISPQILEKYKINFFVDGKNCLNKKDFQNSSVIYKGIGRG